MKTIEILSYTDLATAIQDIFMEGFDINGSYIVTNPSTWNLIWEVDHNSKDPTTFVSHYGDITVICDEIVPQTIFFKDLQELKEQIKGTFEDDADWVKFTLEWL